MEESETVDQWVMLFSADWFRPYWHAVGFNVAERGRSGFQAQCQDIVRQIMEGAETYWLTSFEPARVWETQRRFLEGAQSTFKESLPIERLRQLISRGGTLTTDEVASLAIALINNRLIARPESLPELEHIPLM